ncbi:hypothetical protein DDZ14_08580 [Maritimibacter sp. 55A14]|uniref:hypothetical protein n=1 Tax=Maritimibacter sp. 55A14 TaxID=2174844 RepID=UPI000D620C1A|nr:hypothetical protein [Maritimibacter sp. 55A14]PWE32792.1 hypothetical protein DDZ14_08580 [Maritimibacter sp. 55A14]
MADPKDLLWDSNNQPVADREVAVARVRAGQLEMVTDEKTGRYVGVHLRGGDSVADPEPAPEPEPEPEPDPIPEPEPEPSPEPTPEPTPTPTPTPGTGQAVANAAELRAALASATGGETFLLAPGDYGDMPRLGQYASPVTIASADRKNPARFSRAILKGVSNVALDGLHLKYAYSAGDAASANRFAVLNSQDVTLTRNLFEGAIVNGAGHGRGLQIRDSIGTKVLGNEFKTWWKACSTGGACRDTVFNDNDVHHIRSDGFGPGDTVGLECRRNWFHDNVALDGSGDHKDMIQLMGVIVNGVFADNVFDIGVGNLGQTLFSGTGQRDTSTSAGFHKNLLIERNIVYNAQTNGIAIHAVDGCVVRDNTLIAIPVSDPKAQGGVAWPKINITGTNIEIARNIAAAVSGSSGARIRHNAELLPDTYAAEFIRHADTADGYHEYSPAPGGVIASVSAAAGQPIGAPIMYRYPLGRGVR